MQLIRFNSAFVKSVGLLGLFFLCALYTHGQYGLQNQFLPSQMGSQYYQPAFLARYQFQNIALGIDGNGWFQSNAFAAEHFLTSENKLSQSTKDAILNEISGDNQRVIWGYNAGISVNFRIGNKPWSLSARRHDTYALRVNSPLTAALILNGNNAYAGQTLTDEDIYYRSVAYDEWGLGTAWENDKWIIGARIKLLVGHRAQIVDDLSYTLFTEADGSRVDIQSTYKVYETITPEVDGIGLGADIGVIYKLNDKIDLHFSAINLGVIPWDGRRREESVDFEYTGFDLDNLIGDNAEGATINVVDTLEQLFFPTSDTGSFNSLLPLQIQAGIIIRPSKKQTLSASIHAPISGISPTADFPIVNVAYFHKVLPPLTLGANLYGGGLDRYGLGLLGALDVQVADPFRFQLFVGSENLLGLFFAQGAGIQGGISFSY